MAGHAEYVIFFLGKDPKAAQLRVVLEVLKRVLKTVFGVSLLSFCKDAEGILQGRPKPVNRHNVERSQEAYMRGAGVCLPGHSPSIRRAGVCLPGHSPSIRRFSLETDLEMLHQLSHIFCARERGWLQVEMRASSNGDKIKCLVCSLTSLKLVLSVRVPY